MTQPIRETIKHCDHGEMICELCGAGVTVASLRSRLDDAEAVLKSVKCTPAVDEYFKKYEGK